MAILPNNIHVWDKPNYWENSCRALPPNSSHPQGKIVLLPGQGGDSEFLARVITRPIYGADGTTVDVDVASSTEYDLPNPGWLHGHTDNQLVRQRDGSLAAMKACFNWKPVPNPKPWQQLSIPENRKPYEEQIGPRATNFVWRGELAPPVTEIQWALQGGTDPFLFNDGTYGFPRPVSCADTKHPVGEAVASIAEQCQDSSKPQWTCPGSDRPELYACPFTGHLYLTAAFFSGPYYVGPFSDHADRFHNILLLYSANKGLEWHVLKDDFGGWTPLVMTSTPNGRLFLYQWMGDDDSGAYLNGNLFCSGVGRAQEVPTIVQVLGPPGGEHVVDGDPENGYELNLSADGKLTYADKPNGPFLLLPPDPDIALRGLNPIATPAISRASTDKATSRVRVSLPALSEHGRNIVAIIDLEIEDAADGPSLKPGSLRRAGRIEANDPLMHSVLHGTFIDPDYVDTPRRFASNTSLFYWLEWPGRGLVSQVACATERRTGDLHVLAIDPQHGLWHTARKGGDGSWSKLIDVQAEVPGAGPGPTPWVACAADSKTRGLHVLAIDEHGRLWQTIRKADGSWPNPFTHVQAAMPGENPGPARRVACAIDAGGDLQLLVVGDNDWLWHTVRNGVDGSWSALTDVVAAVPGDGPAATPRTACASDPRTGDLHVLVIDQSDGLWHTIRKADSSWPYPFGDVQAVVPGDGPGPTPFVACATNAQGDLHVLVIDEQDGLWHTVRIAVDGSWPEPLGDVQAAVPGEGIGPTRSVACATDARGDLHLLVINENEGLWYTIDTALKLTSDPVAGSMAPDHEHVFAHGNDGAVWQKWWVEGSGWSDWMSLGAPPKSASGFVGGPATVSRSPEFCNVYVRGGDNGLWLKSYDGSWHDWGTLGAPAGTPLASDPVADSMAPDHEHVFVGGADGKIYQNAWLASSGWLGWVSLGAPPGGFVGGPATVSRSPEFCNVYVRGGDNGLWLKSYDGSWHDWQKLGMSSWPKQFGDVQAALPAAGPSWFPNDMSARYCLFDSWPSQQSTVDALSVQNGALRSWNGIDVGGDYLSGGFFHWKGMNYVAQWREPKGIRANIVHLP